MVGVVLRFSSIASCADTRGVRVESPIRPFLTQQIASYVLGVSRLLLGDFNEGIFQGWVFGSRGGLVSY